VFVCRANFNPNHFFSLIKQLTGTKSTPTQNPPVHVEFKVSLSLSAPTHTFAPYHTLENTTKATPLSPPLKNPCLMEL